MSWLRKNNRLTITPSHKKKPVPYRGRTVITGFKLPVFHRISQLNELVYKLVKGLSLFAFHGLAPLDRSPCLKFGDILQNYYTGSHLCRPSKRYPRQTPYPLAYGSLALCP